MKQLMFALALVVSTPAIAGFNDGNSFLETCTVQENRGYCNGYVSGLVDAMTPTVCVPDGVTPPQIADIIIRTLKDSPEIRHGRMDQILAIALTERPLC